MTRDEYIQKITELTDELHSSTGFTVTKIKFKYQISQDMIAKSFSNKAICIAVRLETLE